MADERGAAPAPVLLVSHSADSGTFKVGSHHYARELCRRGHQVIHLSTPVTLIHLLRLRKADRARIRDALRGPRKDKSGVIHVVPLTIVPTGYFPRALRCLAALSPVMSWLRLRRMWAGGVVVIDQPDMWADVRRLRRCQLIYRPTDVHFDERVMKLERQILNAADGLVGTSPKVVEHMLGLAKRSLPSLVLENGVEYERFRETARTRAFREGACYIGALDQRFDWQAVRDMGLAFPELPIRLAGPLGASPPADLPENVELVGPVAYSEAPDFLARHEVGLLPLSSHPGNAARSPMKYYEYLASGLYVVGSATPTLKERATSGVYLYEDGAAAGQMLAKALKHSSHPNMAGAEQAAAYSWEARAAELVEFASSLAGSR